MQPELARFERYLKQRYPGRSTRKHYISDLRIFQRFVGDITPRMINSQTISAFVEAQSQEGLRATTINRRLSSISSFFQFLSFEAEDDDWSNPVHWKYHSIRPGQRLPRDVDDQTVNLLMMSIDDLRDLAMFTLMVGAGLRVGEVVDLQLEDLDLRPAPQSSRLLVRGKGGKERVVWLTAAVTERVNQWLVIRPTADTSHLFLNQHLRPLSVSGVQFRLKQYCRQAGVHLTCHQLRHTFARRLVEHQMPIESLAKLLGHSDLRTTQRYIDGADPTLRQDFLLAMQQMDELMVPKPVLDSMPPSLPAPLTPDPRPDPVVAVDEVAHLGHDLPDWLHEVIQQHTIRRVARWQPHRVKALTHHHFGTLCRMGRWLVENRHWRTLDQLRRADLIAYVNARLETQIKPSSIATELTVFRAFWRGLLYEERVTNGAVLEVKAPPTGDPLPRYLTLSQFQRLEAAMLDATKEDTPKDRFNRAWFYLLAHGGLRRSEVLNLRLSDCDLTGRRLRVRAGKGNRDRVLPMSPQMVSVIQNYLVVREPASTDHLLIYRLAPVKQHLIPDRLRTFGHKAGLKGITPHRLRHTLATFLINHGMPITSLQKFLGHQDINKTMIYARVHNKTVKEQFSSAMSQIEAVPLSEWSELFETNVISAILT